MITFALILIVRIQQATCHYSLTSMARAKYDLIEAVFIFLTAANIFFQC